MVSKAEGAVKTVLVGNTHHRKVIKERDRGEMNSSDQLALVEVLFRQKLGLKFMSYVYKWLLKKKEDGEEGYQSDNSYSLTHCLSSETLHQGQVVVNKAGSQNLSCKIGSNL